MTKKITWGFFSWEAVRGAFLSWSFISYFPSLVGDVWSSLYFSPQNPRVFCSPTTEFTKITTVTMVISVGARKKVFHSSVPVPQVTRFFPTLWALCSQKHPNNSNKKDGLMFVMMQNSIKKWWLSSSFQLLPQLLACDDLVYCICSIHFVSKGFCKNDWHHKDYMIIIAYFFDDKSVVWGSLNPSSYAYVHDMGK